jgi:energy-coupling factor transporter ATP-binding protein EcfA2
VADAVAVRVANLHYWYEGGTPVLHDVNLSLGQGERIALVGQNGSGKTTLVKHFNGLLRPRRGTVWAAGMDTAEYDIGELAHHVGYVFQNPDHQIFSTSVADEIAFGLRNLGLDPTMIEQRTNAALTAFELTPYAEAPPAVLSYGLRRRITVAAVWAMRPSIIILDEPTTGLDRRHTRALMHQMLDLQQEGRTLILITHDMKLVAEYAERVVVMQAGRISADGSVRAVFEEEEQLAQSFLAPPPITSLGQRLRPCGLPGDLLTVDEFTSAYLRLRN